MIEEIIKSITVCGCDEENALCVSLCVIAGWKKVFEWSSGANLIFRRWALAALKWKRDWIFNCSASVLLPSRPNMLSPIHYLACHITWITRQENHFQIIWISLQNLSHSSYQYTSAKISLPELLSQQYVIRKRKRLYYRECMMYSRRDKAYWLWPLWGKGPSPSAEVCHMEFVSICARQRISQFLSLFPFSLLCIPMSLTQY